MLELTFSSALALTLTFKKLEGLIVCVFMLSRAFLIFTGNIRNHFVVGAFLDASETMVVFWPCSCGGWIAGPGFHFMSKCVKSSENYFFVCHFAAQGYLSCFSKLKVKNKL